MSRFSVNPRFIKLFIASFVVMVSWAAFMGSQLKPLTSSEIIRFEFAGTQETVETILAEWQAKDWIELAKNSVYLDFVFLFLYGATLALGCLTFPSFANKPGLMIWGMRCYRFSLYAALSDFLENLCLMEILYGSEHTFFPAAAWVFAFVKFALVLVVFTFLILCLAQAVIERIVNR
jgi:hypothetical protein